MRDWFERKKHDNTSFSFSFYSLTFLLSLGLFQQASCQWPGRIDYGRKFGHGYKHGDTVQFLCNNGYILHGKQNLTCADGVWSSHRSACRGSYEMQTSKTFEKRAVSKICILSCQVPRESLNIGLWLLYQKAEILCRFFLFISLEVRMVIRNRNRVVHFSYRGNKEHEYSLLGTSPAVKAMQDKLFTFSLSWLEKLDTFLMFLLSS